ncbi:MAG: phosphonate metabolism protein/1,5-bisphosphokinase (PRPP-forming) PhnN [Promethearchaeota archaeon]
MKNYTGILFLIVGNSGSGKDSIISGVIQKYPSSLKKIYAPKRYITREPSGFESNIAVSLKKFKEMEVQGKFALKWSIYGLNYGIPIEIENCLEKGHPVIINVSRTIVKEAREKYKNVKVIFIEVPFDITYHRIKNRKREEEHLLRERIERAKNNQKFPEADYTINNAGELNDAVNNCLTYLLNIVNKKKT